MPLGCSRLYVRNLKRCAPVWHIWFSLTNFRFYPSVIARVLQLTLFLVQVLGFLVVNSEGISFLGNLFVLLGVSILQVGHGARFDDVGAENTKTIVFCRVLLMLMPNTHKESNCQDGGVASSSGSEFQWCIAMGKKDYF